MVRVSEWHRKAYLPLQRSFWRANGVRHRTGQNAEDSERYTGEKKTLRKVSEGRWGAEKRRI